MQPLEVINGEALAYPISERGTLLFIKGGEDLGQGDWLARSQTVTEFRKAKTTAEETILDLWIVEGGEVLH